MYRYLKQNKIGHEGYFPKPKDKFNLYTHTLKLHLTIHKQNIH